MFWESLYQMQERLDHYIEQQHNLEKSAYVESKILALFVELGELANETRCFKFWSTKGPSAPSVIQEEYVDGVHFLLSLGLDLGFRYTSQEEESRSMTETEAFLDVYSSVETFRHEQTKGNYEELFRAYVSLGRTIGITAEDLKEAYINKNEVNFKRQDQGY
ncbi:dUTP diphosphatase [Halobacillus kuroshimensis]|uniref:dUTP diphosphatase n=1 Tax=Halobacillus kuroshimensis TaxID=302481 RepID=A0ABS3DZV3_9BACI|nr:MULTISPECIES: dUTP diphosphatase [Halobacillus]MBN8236891.1 dUTP diphosphatase [Halobacillus kuroshimensis]